MPYKFSPSSLSLLKDCPRCFWLHFNKGIKRPEGIFPSLPSGMDRVLKEHFDCFIEKNQLPPELKELKDVKLFDDKEKLEEWRNNRKGIQWTDENGNVFKGAVDNLLKKGESRGIGSFSAKQLAFMTIKYASTKSMKGLIAFMFTDQFLQKKYPHPKDRLQATINNAYQLRKHWFEYKLPKLIKTVSTIQSFVYEKKSMEQGDYTVFAAQVENSFLPDIEIE